MSDLSDVHENWDPFNLIGHFYCIIFIRAIEHSCELLHDAETTFFCVHYLWVWPQF